MFMEGLKRAKETWCLSCGAASRFTGAFNDELGWHTVCPECESSYDIDIEDHLVPDGKRVGYNGGKQGIVCGNNAADAPKYSDIRYYICPIEETRIAGGGLAAHYVSLTRGEFDVFALSFNDLG